MSGDNVTPHAFIQWKGTDVCMDFHCECGAECHFDGFFANVVQCPHCNALWEMPNCISPRKADEQTPPHIPRMMQPDEDIEP